MIEQAMAEAIGADFAFITTGNVRNTLPAGPLLARQIWNMLPFEDHVVMGRFKGSELPPRSPPGIRWNRTGNTKWR